MELKKWFRIITMIPLILFFVITNMYQDPGGIYHDIDAQPAKELMRGKEVFFRGGNGDERGVKQYLIEYMPKHVECMTIGPSLSLGIRSANVGTTSYYNLSASSLNFYDIMAEFAFLELNEVKAERVIFCVDSYFFNDMLVTESKKDKWMPYANYMINKLDGNGMHVLADDLKFFSKDNLKKMYKLIRQAVSITYFQSSWELVQKNGKYIQGLRWGVMDENTTENAHYMPDGSWVYSAEYRNSTVDDVVETAINYDIQTEFAYGRHISEDRKKYFDKLIAYLTNNDIEVEFYLCPLSPALWDRLGMGNSSCQYYILDEIERYAHEIAEKYDLKITGSYNPYSVGISDEDFWDCRHVRHDRLEEFFDFRK